MNLQHFSSVVKLGLIIVTLGFLGCGSDNVNGNLTITPAGPVLVLKGDTLQFTANQSNVTWSVPGGAEDGSISAAGLYSPPATLPIASAPITIQAENQDGDIATSSVDLRSGFNVTFGDPISVNSAPMQTGPGLNNISSGGDWLAVRLGSLQIDSSWGGANGAVNNVFYSQNNDLGGFLPGINLTNDSAVSQLPGAIETNSEENPGIVYTNETLPPRVFFLGSADQGASFGNAVSLFEAAPAIFQTFPVLRVDAQDKLHAVFIQEDGGIFSLNYVNSSNDGSQWSAPQPVNTEAIADFGEPGLAVSPDGQKIFVCWTDTGEGIQFARSLDGGANFDDQITIDPDDTHFCRVARTDTGRVFISFSGPEVNGTNGAVYLSTSSDEGATFSEPAQINTETTNLPTLILPIMAVDNLGRLDLVWEQSSNTDPSDPAATMSLMYARSLNNGAVFTAPVPIATSAAGGALLPNALRHDAVDRLYLQYIETDFDFMSTVGPANLFLRIAE